LFEEVRKMDVLTEDKQGNVSLDKEMLEPLGYKIKQRHLDEIKKYSKGAYKNILRNIGNFDAAEEQRASDEGAEHSPNDLSQKLPNLTLLRNLKLSGQGGKTVMAGQTMGHTHPDNGLKIQEIYEFQGYGAMLLASPYQAEEKSSTLYLAKKGSKVIVPGNCIMTIFNLDMQNIYGNPLLTVDMANPLNNSSDKKTQEELGTMMAIYMSNLRCGLDIMLNSSYPHYGLDSDLSLHVSSWSPKGDDIFDSMLQDHEVFRNYNIELVEAGKSVEFISEDGQKVLLDKPLEVLVADESKPVHKLLGMI
jgi:hypothetical protein